MILRSTSFFLLALPAFAGEPPIMVETKSPSPWRIGAGVMWRNIGELSVDPKLQNSSFSSQFFNLPIGAGEIDAYANRTYDDGFVNIGAATPITGLTTNWGHQSDSQVTGDSLNYSLSGGSAQTFPGSSRDDEGTAPAPYLELSYLRPIRPNLVAGFTANLSLASLDGQTTCAISNSKVSIADHYALNGVIPPTAPYTGSFAGPGTLINNSPTSRDFILTPNGTSNYHFANYTDLYSLALGAEIHWQPAESYYLGIGSGAVINLADWSSSWNLPVPNATGSGSTTFTGANSGENFLWGLYIKGSAGYHIKKHWTCEGFFRYDWNESLHSSVSPSSFELGLTGWSIGLGLSYRF
ncbi:MAG: hypothetical protein H8M99_07360 [Gloeobacteraceae cyanobacterium ES-bin-144]|nr:hypothetical protein [Verrucomicrobiales bacterium]